MVNVHIITQGCSANIADSEVMAGLLKAAAYDLTESIDEADIIIFNTCTVKGPTESFFRKKLKEFEENNKLVVISGCIPQSVDRKNEKSLYEELKEYSLVGVDQIDHIVTVVEEALNGNVIHVLAQEKKNRLNLPKMRKNDFVEIVPVSQGCLGACSFCKTKFARGNLASYPEEDIVRHISNAVSEGVKEIWLTSQDMSAYGLDINTNLPQLLKAILSIPKDFKLRVGMANPNHILNFLDELIWQIKDPRIYSFLHIPVQAGSNKVLKDMARMYDVEDYRYIIKRFKDAIPDILIATDIICGFPTENKKDFEETINLVKETKPDVINISKFWPRPGTRAAKLKLVHGAEVKERSTELTKLFHKVAKENNKAWVGKTCKVLFTEEGTLEGTYIGRNESYKQVVVKSDELLLGEERIVEIESASKFDLKGSIIKEE